MRDGRLIAPLQKLRHQGAVRGREHESAHRLLVDHSVRVQNARLALLNTDTARFPVVFLAARAARSEPTKNAGK